MIHFTPIGNILPNATERNCESGLHCRVLPRAAQTPLGGMSAAKEGDALGRGTAFDSTCAGAAWFWLQDRAGQSQAGRTSRAQGLRSVFCSHGHWLR